MKHSRFIAAVVLMILAIAALAEPNPRVIRGTIADSQCAMNVHSLTRSHEEMLKAKRMGGTPASCALYCITYLGGELVLSSGSKVYRLDDQEAAKKFAGQKVELTGTLAPNAKSIHVISITAQQ
jgi:hypothetical protein